MEINNIIEEKENLENNIANLIIKFQNLTNVEIRNVTFENDNKNDIKIWISLNLDET